MIASYRLGWLYCYWILIINITNKSRVSDEAFAALLRCDTALSRRLPRVGQDWPCQPVFALGSLFWIQQLHFFFIFFFAPQKEKSTNNCVSDWFLMCILGSSGEANEERDITSGQPRPFKGTYYVFFSPPLPRHIGLQCWMLLLNVAKLSNNEVYVWKVIPFSRKLKEEMLTFRRWLPDDKKNCRDFLFFWSSASAAAR